jgi:hypothetical protein
LPPNQFDLTHLIPRSWKVVCRLSFPLSPKSLSYRLNLHHVHRVLRSVDIRLFPHTWEGLHPAFPKQSNDSESCLSVEQPFPVNSRFVPRGDGYSGMAVACIVMGAVPFFSPPTRRFAAFVAKTTVFATGLVVARSINIVLIDRQVVPIFLRTRHIEPPNFPVVDRLTHWDSDD